ncbi:glycine receptor subunit alpha-2-like isoform X3 [Macrosteles quadrilineatus]|uniref:glycine receptor subunit alpha-2-like isoform X3 n=1 Tax=Macrosteles quadrilineatus TaxID=74068 RepID=UPI0023E0D3CC|nr:glycine receptor subunit alpha-2-like isoform X3 [Macrosteles quadrilineatus]
MWTRSILLVMLTAFTLWHVTNSNERCHRPRHGRRPREPAGFRYRPRTDKLCHGPCIEPQHRHLLLLGGTNNRERLRHCSISQHIDGISRLYSALSLSEPEVVILVQVTRDWTPDPQVLDLMAGRLGNVSVFVGGHHSANSILHYCRGMGDRCFRLQTLFPVLTEIHKWTPPGEISSTLLDIYDPRWLPITTPAPLNPNLTLSTHKQIEELTSQLCVRDRRLNRYFELHHTITDPSNVLLCYRRTGGDVIEPGMVTESSLSLRDILPINPKHYDKNRAPKFQGQATIVYFHVTVLSLDSINEESMTYVADIFLAQSWRDPRLRLPENMSEEYRILDVEWLHDIWRPDCFFKNAKKVTFHEMSIPNHYLWLYHDKTLLYMSKLTLVLSCAMKFESYPHDTQICSMMIESLSHTTHDLVFIWNMTDPLVVNPEIELPQLDISNNYTADCTIEYSTGNFTCLAVVFNLRRRLGYHLFHTYIPSALIVVMSWISFWIKPEAIPARVTLGVTSLLTLATQNTQSQQSLPPVSYVKAIDIWMSSCSVFVFLSLMEFAVVNNYMGPIATKAMKGYSEEDVRGGLDDLKQELDPSGRGPPRASILPSLPQYPTFCNGREIALSIDQFSRFFFPFSFFVLNIVYWTSFLEV